MLYFFSLEQQVLFRNLVLNLLGAQAWILKDRGWNG